ncbi:MAG: DUF2716 domain-containing protein [Aquihabitans sp.]
MAERIEEVVARLGRESAQAERRRRRRNALMLAAWVIGFPLVVWLGRGAVASTVGCAASDPDGGLLRDAELCRGDDAALLRATVLPLALCAHLPAVGGTPEMIRADPSEFRQHAQMTDDGVWELIPDYEQFWTPFDQRFGFMPWASEPVRPGITEPLDSVTFSLASVYGSETRFLARAAALNAEVLRAFVDVFPPDERLVVFDWQHPSYWFSPHRQARRLARQNDSIGSMAAADWNVTPFPDGDYFIFLTEDLTAGTFGHPWEQSLCIFGTTLVNALAPALEGRLPVLRPGGISV